MSCFTVKYCDIPVFLRAGGFYRSLSEDSPQEAIEIPADCMTWDPDAAHDYERFSLLLRVTMFWMLDELPLGIFRFCIDNEPEVWGNVLETVPGASDSQILSPLFNICRGERKVLSSAVIELGNWDFIVHHISGIDKDAKLPKLAVTAGNLRLLKYLHEEQFEWDEETCIYASYYGHFDCLRYAHENGCPWDKRVLEEAARYGQLDCLIYGHEQGLPWEEVVCTIAAMSGHLHCLQYAQENGCPWDSDVVRGAAQGGHLSCLQYALERGCPVHEKACDAASFCGQLSCLQLLQQYNAPWNAATCAEAAKCTSSVCLQYLFEHNCPWDLHTTVYAARSGRLETLRFAMEHGCPYDSNLLQAAVIGDSLDCVQYLLEVQGLAMSEAVLMITLLRGNLPLLRYLLDQGCPCITAIFVANPGQLAFYKHVFVKDNPALIECIVYALERGWKANNVFVHLCFAHDYQNCHKWFLDWGWIKEIPDPTVSAAIAPPLLEIEKLKLCVVWCMIHGYNRS